MQPHLAAAVLTQLHNAPVVHTAGLSAPHAAAQPLPQQPQGHAMSLSPSASLARSQKGGIAGGSAEPEFTVEDIQKYFNIPAKQAAKRLNIGITKLKLVCRQLGAFAVCSWRTHTHRLCVRV